MRARSELCLINAHLILQFRILRWTKRRFPREASVAHVLLAHDTQVWVQCGLYGTLSLVLDRV